MRRIRKSKIHVIQSRTLCSTGSTTLGRPSRDTEQEADFYRNLLHIFYVERETQISTTTRLPPISAVRAYTPRGAPRCTTVRGVSLVVVAGLLIVSRRLVSRSGFRMSATRDSHPTRSLRIYLLRLMLTC